MKKRKASKRKIQASDSELKKIAVMQLINFAIFTSVILIISVICLLAGIKPSYTYPISLIVFSVSSFICAYISAFKNRKKGIYTGVLSVVLPIAVFEIISVIINSFNIDFNLLLSSVVMFISAAAGGVAGVNTRLKPKKKRG